MNFLNALCETYDANLQRVGIEEVKVVKDKEIKHMLLPISHTTQTAHIEVLVTLEGELYDAYVIPKINTVIPFTEASGSRSGTTARLKPHMLHDKLISVAGDYSDYTSENVADSFDVYIKQLQNWCESNFSHPYVQAIYNYLKKKQLIHDLVEKKILYVDEQNKLLKKWTSKEEKPEIFKQITGEQKTAFVRFSIHIPGEVVEPLWSNQEVFKSYQMYYETKLKEKDLCYITGEYLPFTTQHPGKIRNSGDMTKLISSNDQSGFTFRGRFTDASQVATVSYVVSQKAHNALKWLIERQGKIIDGRVFLAWGTKHLNIDTPIKKPRFKKKIHTEANTEQSIAKEYQKLLAGYQSNISLDLDNQVFVMTLDAATPGRLAVLYYRSFNAQEYFERLKKWHEEAEWRQSYYDVTENKRKHFIGAPTLETIAKLAFAPRPSDKLIKGTIERLLPCILDGRAIPNDIVRNAIQRASNPVAYSDFEWEEILQVACSLVKKQNNEKGVYVDMTLNQQNKDRSYLFGRLLAVADQLEKKAMFSSNNDETRVTNAIRYMNAFSTQPYRTWTTLHNSLQPYITRLGNNSDYYLKVIGEITDLFEEGTFNNRPLNGDYLLGFYNQRQHFYVKKEQAEV
ncbi:type I-C CRISPR-associated protein Cas8c/Csd1 [Kurthia massiliensis]|uniref:type I-C CRISPR-associated protein Cas8c/Csd1 n=1 Tax=Kurthia massiliensis TaxID=1033739 RepID=UPI0002882D08|nr:type I-C CRISPR-associated protein Cas8c/Csd1 [Kurthia massiliensis]